MYVRKFVSWLVALAPLACTALNPAFGEDDGPNEGSNEGDGSGRMTTASTTERDADTNGGSGSGHSSSPGTTSDTGGTSGAASNSSTSPQDEGTGDPMPSYPCDENGFDIELADPGVACDRAGEPLNVDMQCMIFNEQLGGLEATPATGCSVDSCIPTGGPSLTVSVTGVDLERAVNLAESPCGFMWARGVADAGSCQWDTLSLFHADGGLALILGNRIQGDDAGNSLPVPGEGTNLVQLSASLLDDATPCGQPAAMPCAGAGPGWRTVEFSVTPTPALPDGLPVSASFLSQDLSLFNWGLQRDRQCIERGRWAVVEAGQESVFE